MVTDKSAELLEHITEKHKDIEAVHKEQPSNVNYRIEFLQFNIGDDAENKLLEIVCPELKPESQEKVVKKKKSRIVRRPMTGENLEEYENSLLNRKRSWVWKYFNRLNKVGYRCNLCSVVLSIKGCNTNNMNRHVRSRHRSIYEMETQNNTCAVWTKDKSPADIAFATDKDEEESSKLARRSWIWTYFNRVNPHVAQCRLCKRRINHGGNATGNMNRHLKIIHRMTATDYSWIWKVFDPEETEHYTCKICQQRTPKLADREKGVQGILDHLRDEHAVVSGDQIIESQEEDDAAVE